MGKKGGLEPLGIVPGELEFLPGLLLKWYRAGHRQLPWRLDPTPYHVWVSEIMLQQTRVEAVLGYYQRFLQALPTVQALANATEDQLFKLWEGLGYYSRARNLHRAAQVICRQYQGQLPADYDALLALPGIGSYTAGAIASIAFGQAVPAVDGNVLRVITRLTACEANISQAAVRCGVQALLSQVIDPGAPGEFNQALMELGALVCRPNGAPLCQSCPLASHCRAYGQGSQLAFPVRDAAKARTVVQRSVFLLRCEKQVALHRRPSKGLLAGLWELPGTDGWLPAEAAQKFLQQEWNLPVRWIRAGGASRHIFTHREWQMHSYLADCAQPVGEGLEWFSWDQLQTQCCLPSAFSGFLGELQNFLQ